MTFCFDAADDDDGADDAGGATKATNATNPTKRTTKRAGHQLFGAAHCVCGRGAAWQGEAKRGARGQRRAASIDLAIELLPRLATSLANCLFSPPLLLFPSSSSAHSLLSSLCYLCCSSFRLFVVFLWHMMPCQASAGVLQRGHFIS